MKNFKVILTALVIGLMFVFVPYINARIGVGVGTGKIVVTDKLKPGQIYQFPAVAVLNTGDEDSTYRVQVAYHEQQPELKPPQEWFTFDPNDFELKPTDAKNVEVRVNIPLNAVPGDYFAYIEATPVKRTLNGATSVSVAAAAKLYFTVEPANFAQGVYYRALSLWQLYEPWSSRVAIGLVVISAIVVFRKYLHLEVNIKPVSKQESVGKAKSENDKNG